jgi:hypothetical protein
VFRDDQARAIVVSRTYAGYAGPDKRTVLGVSVRLPEGFQTHIVKLGTPAKVNDYEGWRHCVGDREMASRIFVPLRSKDRKDLPGGRVAVVYRDAYTFFGLNEPRGPETLEQAVEWAVLDDKPDPLSVERVLAQIYTDLYRWFYRGARGDREAAGDFYRRRLRGVLEGWSPPPGAAPPAAAHGRQRQEVRRDAVWLLCGQDPPNPDAGQPPVYLDPLDYVTWALDSGNAPDALVGRSHGDLHGRNVLVGIQRKEAEFPAIFDYGNMAENNVLAWDFAKLETELKVHILPKLYEDPAVRAALLRRSARPRGPAPATGPHRRLAERIDRLEFAFQFEVVLADLAERISGRPQAETYGPPGGRAVTGQQKVDRLLGILLRIRQEAYLALDAVSVSGERDRRYDWKDDLYFALAAYGLCNAKPNWKYTESEVECALISAGVAAARVQAARDALREGLESGRLDADRFPTYRVPLALAYRAWRAGRAADALAALERVMPRYGYAVPLERDYALMLLEAGEDRRALDLLEPLRALCPLFGDYETLCRIGRGYRQRGDRLWQAFPCPTDEMRAMPAGQMYRHALAAYEEAYALKQHYYPGVNCATLARLVGDRPLSLKRAEEVEAACRQISIGLRGDEAFWVYASEGEAALVREAPAEAERYYGAALVECDGQAVQMMQSAYDQICRLWEALGPAVVDPVVAVFRRNALWPQLKPGPLRNCGLPPSPAPRGFKGGCQERPAPVPTRRDSGGSLSPAPKPEGQENDGGGEQTEE